MLGLLGFAVLLSRIQHVEPVNIDNITSTTVQPSTTMRLSSLSSLSTLSTLSTPSTLLHTISTAKPEDNSQCFANEHCLSVLMVIGGLVLACMILMLSTLMLSIVVCLINKRVNALISTADLDSHRGYMAVSAAKESRSSEIELREVSVLLADCPHGVTDATEEVKVEEASPEPAEKSCSPAPQEDAVV